jgi:two-component system, LytTR family, sensor kinase
MRDPKPIPKWRLALILFAVWTSVGLIFSTVSYVVMSNERSRFTDALKYNVVHFYLWAGLSLLIFHFSRRFRVEFRPLKLGNLLLHIPVIVSFAAVHAAIHIAIFWYSTLRFRPPVMTLRDCYRAYFGLGFYLDLIIASLIVITVHAILYYEDFRASQLEQSSLKAQLAEAQLRALKMQLHPHFLFNTLHSISSLVLEDAARANTMIARLGDFLRLTLDHSDEQMVTLKEEVEFLRCYLEIEQVRFGDRLTVDFKMETTTLSACLPHLILQPVVENAIQHAIASRSTPGRIDIEAKRLNGLLRLEVKDTGPGLDGDGKSVGKQGVGLSNVRARLRETYGTQFRFEMQTGAEGGLKVIMELPFDLDMRDRAALPTAET